VCVCIFFALIIKRDEEEENIERHKSYYHSSFSFADVMSSGESNPKVQLNSVSSSSSSPSITLNVSDVHSTTQSPSTTSFYDDKPIEKFYKKEKQILFEFDQTVRGKCNVSCS
jgi:hypothetical protein